MDHREFLEKTATRCGLPLETVEDAFQTMAAVLGDTLARGEPVDLSHTFGKFIPQPREQKLNLQSPRTPKKPHYHICFRPGSTLEKKLRIDRFLQNGGDAK